MLYGLLEESIRGRTNLRGKEEMVIMISRSLVGTFFIGFILFLPLTLSPSPSAKFSFIHYIHLLPYS